MKKEFEIRYTDPETGAEAVVVKEFEDTIIERGGPNIVNKEIYVSITAEEWAEDWAYMIADKEPHTVRELK
jgi:hypothetical protein